MRWGRLVACAACAVFGAPPSAHADVFVSNTGWSWGNPLPQGRALSSVDMVGSRGYAVGDGGAALRTADGGRTWTGMGSDSAARLKEVQAIDADSLVVGGGCTLRRSDDAGRTFRRLPLFERERGCRDIFGAPGCSPPRPEAGAGGDRGSCSRLAGSAWLAAPR